MSPKSKTTSQTKLFVATLSIACLVVAPLSVFAGAGRILDQTGCSVCCPECKHVCKLDAVAVDVEKSCYKVETKVICIPRVVFPWQKAAKKKFLRCRSCDGLGCTSCVHNGARTRTIRVLKTEKYKCPACRYTWKADPKTRVCATSDAVMMLSPSDVSVPATP